MDDKLLILIERLVKVVRELSQRECEQRNYKAADNYESAAFYLETAAEFIKEVEE